MIFAYFSSTLPSQTSMRAFLLPSTKVMMSLTASSLSSPVLPWILGLLSRVTEKRQPADTIFRGSTYSTTWIANIMPAAGILYWIVSACIVVNYKHLSIYKYILSTISLSSIVSISSFKLTVARVYVWVSVQPRPSNIGPFQMRQKLLCARRFTAPLILKLANFHVRVHPPRPWIRLLEVQVGSQASVARRIVAQPEVVILRVYNGRLSFRAPGGS